jgi:hypothetical protein
MKKEWKQIKNYPEYVDNKFLDFVENLMHSENQNIYVNVNYLISKLSSLLSK